MSVLTIREAAKAFRLGEQSVRRLVREQKIPVTMIGNRAYISEEWIRAKLVKDGTLEVKS